MFKILAKNTLSKIDLLCLNLINGFLMHLIFKLKNKYILNFKTNLQGIFVPGPMGHARLTTLIFNLYLEKTKSFLLFYLEARN